MAHESILTPNQHVRNDSYCGHSVVLSGWSDRCADQVSSMPYSMDLQNTDNIRGQEWATVAHFDSPRGGGWKEHSFSPRTARCNQHALRHPLYVLWRLRNRVRLTPQISCDWFSKTGAIGQSSPLCTKCVCNGCCSERCLIVGTGD